MSTSLKRDRLILTADHSDIDAVANIVLSAKARRFLNAPQQVAKFRQAIVKRETEAAQHATAFSRATFSSKLSGRPLAPVRKGRPSTLGSFTSFIEWERNPAKPGFVTFDRSLLEKAAAYWLIQEVGTGHSATILDENKGIKIDSQVGRTIPFNLFWAAGPGAQAQKATTGASGDQLYLAGDVNTQGVSARRKRIRREIKGKHYLQAGGVEGFSYLRTNLGADARKIFK